MIAWVRASLGELAAQSLWPTFWHPQDPAGDQHPGAWAAGQQRADLGLAGGVIQDHQHAPTGQAAAVQGRAFFHVAGDGTAVDPQGAQKPAEDLRRVQRQHTPGAGPTEPRIQLPVREIGCELVSDVDSERALADAGLASDGGDHYRGRLTLPGR